MSLKYLKCEPEFLSFEGKKEMLEESKEKNT